jgi:hypothetical protein
LRHFDGEFRKWFQFWDEAFSQKYTDAGICLCSRRCDRPSQIFSAFYRQSLQIQHLHAELFHNATALRGVNGPDDVQKMPSTQRDLSIHSIHIARQVLEITVNSPTYREGMRYGTSKHPCPIVCLTLSSLSRSLHPRCCNLCCFFPPSLGSTVVSSTVI